MTPVLAAITLLITPSPRTDVALSCVDPGSHTPYRVAARHLTMDEGIKLLEGANVITDGLRVGFPSTGWVFVRYNPDAVCTEVSDHQSHASHWFGSRRHTGVVR